MTCQPPAPRRADAPKCNPGPTMRNPYLNFCREFRLKHCGLRATELIKKAAEAWRALPKKEREKYIVEAYYASKIRRRRSKLRAGRRRQRAVRRSRMRRTRRRR